MEPLARLVQASSDNLRTGCGLAAAIGLLAHSLYFIHGTLNAVATRIFLVHLAVLSALAAKSSLVLEVSRGSVVTAALFGSYLAALFTSITAYRVFFHRLSHFPGGLGPKVSQLYNARLNVIGKKVRSQWEGYHEVYGDFVRVAPNELSIVRVDAVRKIHGATTRCTKTNTGVYEYNRFRGVADLEFVTDRSEHRERRRVWHRATGKKESAKHEGASQPVILQLMKTIGNAADGGTPTDITGLVSLFTFDHIGAVAYSRDLGGLRTGKPSEVRSLLTILFTMAAKLGGLTWPMAMLADFPSFGLKKEMEDLGLRFVREREKLDTLTGDDILGDFIADYCSEKPVAFENYNKLAADAILMSIGGTETLDSTLSYTFYYLAKNPHYRSALRSAIAPAFGASAAGEFRNADLERIPLVDGVIKEVLRLHAPTTVGGPRFTPPEGIYVDDVWIPGGVVVWTPTDLIQRSEKYFKHAKEFIPERWTTKPELILDRRAFFPFTIGRHECPGKWIAMSTMRRVVAYAVWDFDWDFAPGDEGSSIWRQEEWLFTRKPGPLPCVFRRREECPGSSGGV
ncbi:uncharacterized protein DNG_06686 [Cephalotrichum gorgonifer]|uniref:P450 domain-containing protein n=1 Tax=Cephalotrichum gorgonifer TaxID=2041049 RepID=A0AAE8SWS7_9PEZI|nr:uncharacterized protein DNG_06686 [Cephalotrichum gorgonifer]